MTLEEQIRKMLYDNSSNGITHFYGGWQLSFIRMDIDELVDKLAALVRKTERDAYEQGHSVGSNFM